MASAAASAARTSYILSCWKEIADYFGKGVRTVQRWETLGMPVHRPSSDKNIVIAYPQELTRWVLHKQKNIEPSFEHCERLIAESRLIAEHTRMLIAQSQELLQLHNARKWHATELLRKPPRIASRNAPREVSARLPRGERL